MHNVKLKEKTVGDGHDPVFLAEINSAFDQDLNAGKGMIKAAAEAGCDFLKAEIIQTTDIVLDMPDRYEYEYGDRGQKTSERWYDVIARKMNPLSFYEDMFAYSRSVGLEFIVSVYDLESVDFLSDIKAAGIKIPSSNLNHEPIIRAASRTGIPLIFDTGKATLADISQSLNWAQAYSSGGVILNHHPGQSPAPADVHNLNIIRRYKQAFDVPVGLSCHYIGEEILYAAVGVGANLIEKPISFDPLKKDLDTVFASHIDDLQDIVQRVKNCGRALGSGKARPFTPGKKLDQWMGVVARDAMSAGSRLTTKRCCFAWPCVGISVADWTKVEGRRLSRDVSGRAPINWSDIDFDE